MILSLSSTETSGDDYRRFIAPSKILSYLFSFLSVVVPLREIACGTELEVRCGGGAPNFESKALTYLSIDKIRITE
jgi:hypothetical protein